MEMKFSLISINNNMNLVKKVIFSNLQNLDELFLQAKSVYQG